MARIVAASDVCRHLAETGWLAVSAAAAGTLVFQRRDERVTLPLHPRRPEFVYLSDLAQRLSAVHEDLLAAATDEPIESVAGFEVLIDQAGAAEGDLDALRTAIDGLNRAVGGDGLLFEEVRVPGQPELADQNESDQMLRIRRFRARPRTGTGEGTATESAWRRTIALVASRALPTIERRRRALLASLLERVPWRAGDNAADEPLHQATAALDAAERTITEKRGVLRYPSTPLTRELDTGPRYDRRAADRRQEAFRELRDTTRLPVLSGSVLRISETAGAFLGGDGNVTALVGAVESDPAIAAKVIHRATRANVPVPREAKDRMNVALATRLLGAQRVRNIALGSDLVSQYGSGPCGTFDYTQFWQECTARGAAARVITRASGGIAFSPDEAYTAGLLCQIGRLAFATALPEEYAPLIVDAAGSTTRLLHLEFERFRLDHHELAAEMMSDWRMPDLKEAVLHQGNPRLLRGRRERMLARVLHWSGVVWEILRRGGRSVERSLVDEVEQYALELGVGSWALPQEFDKVQAAWAEEADLMRVLTTAVPPWQRIVEDAYSGGPR